MKIINFFRGNILKILVIAILFFGSFSLVYFLNKPISFVKAEGCNLTDSAGKTLSLPNTTFIKAYRLLVFTKINGAWPTKDGGYIISGTTDPNIMFIPPDGFVAKLNNQGDIQWLKFLKTTNAGGAGNPKGDEDVQAVIELKSGGYLMVSKVWGFITAKEWKTDNKELNKILFTRLDKNGNQVWSKSFTAFVEDAKNSLIETNDNGFLFYASITDLAPDKRGEDSEVYYDEPYSSLKVIKFDLNGNLKWSKNIKNFISRKNDSYLIATADGGYALAGNIAEENSEKSAPYNFDVYPGLVKFDKDFNFQWAKSLEGVPLQLAAALPKAGGGYELGWKKIRQGASVIRSLIKTPDNGYLVLGNLSAASSLLTDSQDLQVKPKGSLLGYKFNSAGSLEWVKKITPSFNDYTAPLTNFSASLTKDNKIILSGPITWADDDYQKKAQAVNDLRKWYGQKYGDLEILKEEKKKTKQSQQDFKKVQAAIKTAGDAYRSGIFMMKMNQELDISWAKIINPSRGAINYVLKATPDNGAIVAGEYETNIVKSVLYSSITYYKDGFLLKFDASGNVNDNKKWLLNFTGQIVTEMMTPYAVSNDLVVQTGAYPLSLTIRKPEISSYKKAKTSVFAPFKNLKTILCPVAPTLLVSDTPLQNSTSSSTAQRTWPQINYEKQASTQPVNDKSRTIHNELLTILNQLYNNQVKLIDNMSGSMLSYVFNRVITADDLTAVQKYLEGLGYKTQDAGKNQLTMYKPGYFLILTFSVNNIDKAFLDVTY